MLGLAYGATLRNPEEAKELAEKVLARVVVGDMDGVMTVVKPYWPFPDNELEALVAQTAQQRHLLANRLGKSVGFTLVRREVAADTFLRLVYVERFENTGLRWMFTFIRSRMPGNSMALLGMKRSPSSLAVAINQVGERCSPATAPSRYKQPVRHCFDCCRSCISGPSCLINLGGREITPGAIDETQVERLTIESRSGGGSARGFLKAERW